MERAEIEAMLKEALPGLLKESLPSMLTESLKESLNPALTDHTKRVQKALSKEFDEKFAKLSEAKPKSEEDDADAKAKAEAEAKSKTDTNKVDPAVSALQKELADLRKESAANKAAMAKATSEAIAERRARVEDAAITNLRKHLTGKVLPGAEEDLVDLLRTRKQVTVTDSGDLRFRLSQSDPEEGLDLETGVSQFLKLPTVKHFLPAPNAGQPVKKPLMNGSAPLNGHTGKSSPADAFEAKTGKSIDSFL